MALPKPTWTTRLPGMKVGEVIVVESALSYKTAWQHVNQAGGRFKTKTLPGGFRIERVG